jgi:predicted nucleic acid-binding protein
VNAVADASPLIVLAKIGYLDLVPTLYKTISLEVNAEVVVAGACLPGASQVAKSDSIEVRQLANSVLMDESRGRSLAKERGLEVRGTIGILENLFPRGAIPDLSVAFQRILAQGAYVSLDLLNERLHSCGLPPLRHR